MANATAAVSGTVKGGMVGTAVTAAKSAVISPLFGVAALCGIIAFEWWKGAKDARKFSTAKNCPEETSK
jgi:hypothetical protein